MGRPPHQRPLHAWYSEQHAKEGGSKWYYDRHGDLVEVTRIDVDRNSEYHWPDAKYLGIVEQYAHEGQKGNKVIWCSIMEIAWRRAAEKGPKPGDVN